MLRHTFGTRLVRGGYDLVLVAELMGHARTLTTRGYATADDAQAAINSLPQTADQRSACYCVVSGVLRSEPVPWHHRSRRKAGLDGRVLDHQRGR